MGKWDNRMMANKKHYLSSHQPQIGEIVQVGNQHLTRTTEAVYLGDEKFSFKNQADSMPVFRWWRAESKRFSAFHLGINIDKMTNKARMAIMGLGIE